MIDCCAWQILGLLITYFLVVVQFASTTAGSAPTDATNSSAGFSH